MSKPPPILCLDFDGVLHSYTSGWRGPEKVIDEPTPGAMEWLAEAVNHFTVHIYSSRSGQIGGIDAMKKWLLAELCAAHQGDGHDIFELLQWPTEKPPALVTIDDRAITFRGDWGAPELKVAALLAFRPWNK